MPVTSLELLREWVYRQTPDHAEWLDAQYARLSESANECDLHLFLGLAPRRLGKQDLALSPADLALANRAYPGWNPSGWSLDGAARIAALLTFRGPRPFPDTFQDLVRTADARELITLYRGLALYSQAESLTFEVGEGLRSNMRAVFESIVHRNPYPRDHFDEHRWNHIVLKALFIGSRLGPIVGLDQRANAELARILLDYAQERWAAGRQVSPELWRCIGPFAESVSAYEALQRALAGTSDERGAATLALTASDTPSARTLLLTTPDTTALVAEGRINWDNLTLQEAA
ncbi:EboA domain-containing protein [Salinicola halimionae]|uniref:EboA domain-containing protein n=1 Tax=Salinicola halimionae TaxID=1949081 RepID=UPI000DA1ED18|nr:EboA domain-containing protein [Salinicola halimionae]